MISCSASPTTVMTEVHEQHLARLKATIAAELDAKYRKGQAEHGGFLWRKPGMLDQAIDEVLDLAVYLYTLRDQLNASGYRPSYDEHQANAPLVTCTECGRQSYMTVPQPICATCRP